MSWENDIIIDTKEFSRTVRSGLVLLCKPLLICGSVLHKGGKLNVFPRNHFRLSFYFLCSEWTTFFQLTVYRCLQKICRLYLYTILYSYTKCIVGKGFKTVCNRLTLKCTSRCGNIISLKTTQQS